MLPVWIINLTEDASDKKLLTQLIDSLPAEQRLHWYYTQVDSSTIDNLETCKTMLKELVKEGCACYDRFQKSSFVIKNFQICIIGNSSEPRTQTCFQLLPVLLREFMPSIMSNYVGRGVEVTGVLYIPDNINQRPLDDRMKCAVFLEELNIFTKSLKSNYYNKIIVYQDIQRPDARYYPKLDKTQLQELLFQYLLHLFYIDDNERKLLDDQQDSTFYALGAASIYYDAQEHKQERLCQLFNKVLDEIKDPKNVSDKESEVALNDTFPPENIIVDEILDRLQDNCAGLNVNLRELEGIPKRHPVYDLFNPRLYLSYFENYLRFMPARAIEFTRAYNRLLLGKISIQIKKNKERTLNKYDEVLQQIFQVFKRGFYRHPTIAQLKDIFIRIKNKLEEERDKARELSVSRAREVFSVPGYLKTYYEESKTDVERYSEKELAKRMKTALQSQPSTLALLARCFILSSLSVFVIIPLLRNISPFIINLGDVAEYEYLWIIGIFVVVFGICALQLSRRLRFIKKCKHILLAHSLVKTQEKASKEVYNETLNIYEQLIGKCNEALSHCDKILDCLKDGQCDRAELAIPRTLFNQPFIEGNFEGEKILLDNDMVDLEINIANIKKKISRITKSDSLTILGDLFRNVNGLNLYPALSDNSVGSSLENSLAVIKSTLNSKIIARDTHNIVGIIKMIISKDEIKINMRPLLAMAHINGITTSSTSQIGYIVRSSEDIHTSIIPDKYIRFTDQESAIESVLFVSSWSRLDNNKLNVEALCGVETIVDKNNIPFSLLMTFFYTQYRRNKNVYALGKVNIPVSTEVFKKLDVEIKNIKL